MPLALDLFNFFVLPDGGSIDYFDGPYTTPTTFYDYIRDIFSTGCHSLGPASPLRCFIFSRGLIARWATDMHEGL